MKAGKSISLDIELWSKIADYAKKRGYTDVSSALEDLIRKGLKNGN